MPEKPQELGSEEALIFKSIFDHRPWKFLQSRDCLNLSKDSFEVFFRYAVLVNKHFERFGVTKCTSDEFKEITV